MIDVTAAQVAAATGGELQADPDVIVTGPVVVDSRLVEPGSLFVAIAGNNVDGADFASVALERGATLVLANRPLGTAAAPVPTVVVPDVQRALGELARYVLQKVCARNPGLQIAAVTGSYGKTTTKDTLAQLLAPSGPTVSPKGSFNNEIGLPLTVLSIAPETDFAVLEMGADHPGNIEYLTRIAPPHVGIVLAVGTAHMETFGSREGIAKAKSEMLAGTRPDGSVVLNADDPLVTAMTPGPRQYLVKFGRSDDAQVRAENVRLDPLDRAEFDLVVPEEFLRAAGDPEVAPVETTRAETTRYRVQSKLVGEHHITNALAAATAALLLGIPPDAVAQRLSNAAAISPHRMAVTERSDGIVVIDDSYNANPEAMGAAMQSLQKLAGPSGRAIAVLGEMRELGEDATAAHDRVGRMAVRLGVDQLLVVGEGARALHEGAIQEGSWGGESIFVPDLDAARAALAELLRPGDVVLVKASNGSGLWRLGDDLAAETISPGIVGPHHPGAAQ